MSSQYPWVPPEYYPAVKYACKLIRETGWRNKAIHQAAAYYNVDEDQLAKHVTARSASGRRPTKGYKMKYFVIRTVTTSAEDIYVYGDHSDEQAFCRYEVFRGKSEETVLRRCSDDNHIFNYQNDTGSDYSSLCRYSEIVKECKTRDEAMEVCQAYEKGSLR